MKKSFAVPLYKVEVRDLSYTYGINKPRAKLLAHCTSDECRLASKDNDDRTEVGVVKDVPYSSVFCPDCEYALFWSKE